MAQRSNVPKFGNWEDKDEVPYTIVFNEARKNRGGKMVNPNDPQENPEMFNNNEPHSSASRSDQPAKQGHSSHRSNRDDHHHGGELKNSPARNDYSGGRGQSQRPVRPSKPSVGSDHSIDKSPLHPQARVVVDSSSHGTPGRSRLRPATPNRGDESPDKGAAVPRFGAWDENDPQSAENFTHIFNRVREERNSTGPGNASGTPRHNPSYETRTRQAKDPKKCCFPWW